MAGDERFQLLVELREPVADGERFEGEFLHEGRHGRLARYGDALGLGSDERGLGQTLRLAQARGLSQVLGDPCRSGRLDLGVRHEAGEECERRFGSEVEGTLEAWMDGGEELAHAGDAPGLVLDEIASTRHQEANGNRGVLVWPDRAQVRTCAHQIGDDAGIPRIALCLAAGEAVGGPIDRDPGHVNEGETLGQEHGFQEAGDRAGHVEADGEVAPKPAQISR